MYMHYHEDYDFHDDCEACQEDVLPVKFTDRTNNLRKALEVIEKMDRDGHDSKVAALMGYIARKALIEFTGSHVDYTRED